MVPAEAHAQNAPIELQAALQSAGSTEPDIRAFYEARGNRPIWIHGSSLGPEAVRLLDLVETANLDGLNPKNYHPRSLASAIKKAKGGSPKALAKAEMLLSRTFADYARDVRRPRDSGMVYVDAGLAPSLPTTGAILQAAASAPSLQQHLESIGWMHPIYGALRNAFADRSASGHHDQALRANLERARALPTNPGRRYILVDAATARLWMYEDGRVRDTMRVIVGKPTEQTPMMAGLIQFAMVNPYWNIPPDLVQNRVAPKVLTDGLSYLKTKRYQILSDWSEKPRVIDPVTVDWKAVAAGQTELVVRQLPGKDNAMGRMKFMFPNELGVYLHDTPDKNLFLEASRRFSSGCVRLEDAPRLAKWLFGKPLVVKSGKLERKVNLPEPIPVYITYFTAAPDGQTIAYQPDVYNRDGAQPGSIGRGLVASR